LIGNYHFAHDYGCVHPGMPLGRKHLRRSRDAPTGGIGHTQRAGSRLGFGSTQVNSFDEEKTPLVSIRLEIFRRLPDFISTDRPVLKANEQGD
jgi:hypothetical protein